MVTSAGLQTFREKRAYSPFLSQRGVGDVTLSVPSLRNHMRLLPADPPSPRRRAQAVSTAAGTCGTSERRAGTGRAAVAEHADTHTHTQAHGASETMRITGVPPNPARPRDSPRQQGVPSGFLPLRMRVRSPSAFPLARLGER